MRSIAKLEFRPRVGRRKWRTRNVCACLWLAGCAVAAAIPATNNLSAAKTGATNAAVKPATVSAPEPAPPTTPRGFVNAGTARLKDGKLREAEAYLETALASQQERFQNTALYNLGHVRFAQGIEELKKSAEAGPTAARGRAAARAADVAIQAADEALAGDDVQKLVAAYIQGRGVRRELREATKVVQKALQLHGAALRKWQRASGDFKSALELNPKDEDARHNADVVDRSIARLIDSIREMEQAANAMGQKQQELGDKMKQMKGRIPAEDMPPGAPGDEEEEEDQPGPRPGEQEQAGKEGEEMSLSPEQAAWLLEGFRLDGDRRLPMGEKNTAEPRDRKRPTW